MNIRDYIPNTTYRNILLALVFLFAVYSTGYIMGNFNSKERNTDIQQLQKETEVKNRRLEAQNEQLQACRTVIDLDRQALIVSSQMIVLSSEIYNYILDNEEEKINKAGDQIDEFNKQLNDLKDKVVEPAKVCGAEIK